MRTEHSGVSVEANARESGRYAGAKKYQCIVCGFVYDESLGDAEHGIAAGTRWEDVPADWSCPECGVAKADFEMVEMVG
jgi:rubredoxin